ncbi:MAG: hypothetical protein ACLFP2_05315 [Candidatus Woesearchaeota archaeon]
MSYMEIIQKIETENNVEADEIRKRLTYISVQDLRSHFDMLFSIKEAYPKLKHIGFMLERDIHKNLRFSFPSQTTYPLIKQLIPYLEKENDKHDGVLPTVNKQYMTILKGEADMRIKEENELLGVFDKLHQWALDAYEAEYTGKPISDPKTIITDDHQILKELRASL